MKTKRIITFLVLLIAVLCGAFCLYKYLHKPAEKEEVTQEVVKIGAILDLSASGSNYGKSLQRGMEIAKDEINEQGGINGKKLSIVYEDSQSKSSKLSATSLETYV